MTTADNLAANNSKVAYTSYFETDKVLAVYSGTLSIAGSGSFTPGYSQTKVGDGPGVKSLTQISWSIDGGTTWQDGDASIRVYSGANIQYDTEVTCAADAAGVYVVVNNNGENASAPALSLLYKVVVLSLT